MKSPLVYSLLAGSILLPAAAQAQEKSPFSGPRIEILGGYDQLRSGSDVDIDTDEDGIFEDNGIDQSVDGFAYGAAVGYDFDLGGVVVGLEGEYMDSTGKQSTSEDVAAPFGYRINVNRDLYLGARVGVQVAPRTLVYAKGGYTNTRVESRFQDRAEDDGYELDYDDGQSIDGFRVGAGVEQLVGPGYVKLEYRYSNYSSMKYDDELFSDNSSIGIDLDRHQVLAGVGVRF
ncbi:MAG: porin family protein [Parasphingorhabdus sp.]|uniref:outer membrane protein n=1 Tax=Parasphingorhabdus sp. TaxID=2709688 RepID=UPI0030014251